MISRYTWLGRCCIFAACVLLFAAPAAAQFDRAQLSGRIKDASAGAVPGATITATNRQTQTATVAVSDSTGFFTFPNLASGHYDVSAELQGFKKSLQKDVALDAAGSLTLDFTLETGAVTEEVTVTAESPVLQTDTSLRKTIESRDIEQLSFSGRNPIGVVGLKAGVVGGSFNNYNFSDLGNGGFSINGSRSDENNITVDGATAIRTRSQGAIVGIQNVDTLQEVQVLTGDYMPEYGRASGGQIRMVTKSGGNRFSGSGSFFYRDDKLQANTWTRNKSPNAIENSGAAPFNFKQYGYSLGGPIMKDKLFFFAAQEWVNYVAVQTLAITVPTAKMRTGDFSELLGANTFFSSPQIIRDPLTGLAFPGNIIPANRLSPNGLAMLNAYPAVTPGFQSGTNNALLNSENPQDQRKDNIRFDYRLNAHNQFSYRYGKYNWKAVDAFRGDVPYARTDWDRPNTTQTASWTSTIRNNIVNEATYTYALDQVFINVLESDLYKRSTYGVNYPYLFPENKEIADKLPTISIAGLALIDGGPYPSSSQGPIRTFANTTTWVKNRHTLKGGVVVRVLGRGRLRPDQRPADPRQHQQPERPLRVRQQHHRAHGRGHVGRGARPLHQLRRDRPARVHAVARPVDRRLRAGFVAADGQDHRRRRPPLRALAALALADEQHRDVQSGVLRQEQHGDREPRDGRDHRRAALQRHPAAGRRLPLVGEQPRRL